MLDDEFENKMLTIFREKLGMSEEEYKAVNFVSMLIFHSEKAIERICAGVIKRAASYNVCGREIFIDDTGFWLREAHAALSFYKKGLFEAHNGVFA